MKCCTRSVRLSVSYLTIYSKSESCKRKFISDTAIFCEQDIFYMQLDFRYD